MTQDFAKKKRNTPSKSKPAKKRKNTRRPAPKQQKAPAWAWLIIGLLLGALITLLIYLANKPQEDGNNQAASQTSKTQSKKENKPPQPRFDFYEILKEQQVEVPDRSSEIKAATPQNIHYYLQAGSFRSRSDAERLRAELVLIDLPTQIEERKSDKGGIWHRVVVGPFKSRSKMAKARSTLASKQLSPLLLKRTID
ncbi:MAG: SPOR domain-containing protein [Cellvibrionaceae bacterium]